jgi:hypothetical protein
MLAMAGRFADTAVLPVQDYYNLVDVYLDAVLLPNCVRDPRTFAQEGWHYELEAPEVPPLCCCPPHTAALHAL